jgi:hypothetical protein
LRFDSIAVWCGVEGFFMSAKLSSKDIRKRIDHPVIDADGHWIEFGPSITDYALFAIADASSRAMKPASGQEKRSRTR